MQGKFIFYCFGSFMFLKDLIEAVRNKLIELEKAESAVNQ